MNYKDKLNQLIEQEMQEYKSDLFHMSCEEVYEKATEICMKQKFCEQLQNIIDTHFTYQDNRYFSSGAKALCKIKHPIDYLYQKWLHYNWKTDDSIHSILVDSVEDAICAAQDNIATIAEIVYHISENESAIISFSDYDELIEELEDMEDSCMNGTPMTLIVYRDDQGNMIPMQEIYFLGFKESVTIKTTSEHFDPNRYPFISKEREAELVEVENLINEFCMDNYQAEADLSDRTAIDLAYTTAIIRNGEEIPLQVSIDLINLNLKKMIDGECIIERKYNSLSDIETELKYLDFDTLVGI